MADEQESPNVATRRDLDARATKFILRHIIKTGDNPDSEQAQKLFDEYLGIETG